MSLFIPSSPTHSMKQAIILRSDSKMGNCKPYIRKEYLESQLKMNKNYEDIAIENNVSTKTVQRYLNKFNLTKSPKEWTEKEIELLTEYYPTKRIKLKEILPHRSIMSIYHKTDRLGLWRAVRPQKYSKDENLFDNWSNEMAYVSGWIWSDGNLEGGRSIRIKIQARDSYILEEIRKAIHSDIPIIFKENYALLSIHSKLIVASLIKLGCKPGDSLHNEFPDVPNSCFFDFLRGYVDGDGSIGIIQSKKSRQKNVLRVTFLGSKQFIENLQKRLENILDIEGGKISHSYEKSDLHRCSYHGKNARFICSKMYENCNDLFLKRKRNKFLEHVQLLGDKNEL